MMLRISFAAAILFAFSGASAHSVPQMPAAIQGQWLPTSDSECAGEAEGSTDEVVSCAVSDDGVRQQCREYLHNPSIENLVGGLNIEATQFRSVAEYGEGTLYFPTKVSQPGPGRWQVMVQVAIDGGDRSRESGTVSFEQKNGELIMTEASIQDGQEIASVATYFRCR